MFSALTQTVVINMVRMKSRVYAGIISKLNNDF